MIEGTASFNLAKSWLKRKDSAIFIVGYMDETTPGYRISIAERNEKIRLTEFNKELSVKCSIKHFKFSAHSNREGLIEIVKKLKPKNVILVHGDNNSISWIGSQVLKEFNNVRVFNAEIGKTIEI
jgi:Cft2 family RNA processing exonuclease